MAEENTTEPTAEEIKAKEEAKKAEEERAEAERKHREFVDKKLVECEFVEEEKSYSFKVGDGLFEFKLPDFLEKTQIKLLLSQITSVPGTGLLSSVYEIEGSGDFDLLCSSKLYTHTSVLMLKSPKDFDIEKLSETESFDLGHLILLCEREFAERKKKALADAQ